MDHQPARAPLPPAVRAWLAGLAGGGEVAGARRLPGATSSVVHQVEVRRGGRVVERFVVRRYLHPLWHAAGADLVQAEAVALGAAASAPVTAPALVAADPQGVVAGAPALVMTSLPGRPRMAGGGWWPGGLADVHARLAGWNAPGAALPRYAPWLPPAPEPPPWTRQPGAWERAIEVALGPSPPSRVGPLHRDLHPGNVLFHRHRPAGVVDWVNACEGPLSSDLARCRANLAVLAGPELADGFLAATGELGRDYHPAWDLVVAVELLPDPSVLTALNHLGARCTLAGARGALDTLVQRALTELG